MQAMGKFETGNDPADHTVAEVNEFLKGDEVTGDEYDRVVQAEREGKNRVGIISGSGVEEAAVPDEPAADEPAPDQAEDVGVTPDEAKAEPELTGDGTGEPLPPADQEPENPLQMKQAEPQKTQTPAEALVLAVERAANLGRPTATIDE